MSTMWSFSNNKKGYIAVLYKFPSQKGLEFDTFISSFENMLSDVHSFNPDFSIIHGHFNARSNKWWVSDTQISKGLLEGWQNHSLRTFYGFRQITSEPTYILKHSSSGIDLVFIDQPSLIIYSSTHLSLHPNCYHKIIHCKIDVKVVYLSSHLIWD